MPVDWNSVFQGKWAGPDALTKQGIAAGTAIATQSMRNQQAEQDRQARLEAEKQKQAQAEQAHEANLQKYLSGGYGPTKETGITFGPQGEIKSLSPRSQADDILRALQMQNLQEERQGRAEERIGQGIRQAGTATMVPALKRGEEAIPGLFTQEKPPELKSVGGMKTLAPNWAVPILEAAKLLPKGAGEERTALQELSNVKIYSASGKQINEKEMQRIQEALALKGIFKPEEIVTALRQMGMTVLEQQKQVGATSRPEAVQAVKERGGLVGYESLPELLGVKPPQTTPANPEQTKMFNGVPYKKVPGGWQRVK